MRPEFRNPFRRPWTDSSGIAASEEGEKTFRNALKGIVGGGITGGVEICITYPTEYVKTKLQLDGKKGDKKYAGINDVVRKTLKSHGFFGLYRGLSVLLLGSVPKSAVRFGAFETAKNVLGKGENTSAAFRAYCGLIAGICEALFAVTPMETIKVKLINDRMSSTPQFKGLWHAITTIVHKEGFGGLYQGTTATVVKQGSNQMIRFYIMETFKNWYRKGDDRMIVPKHVTGAMGAVAGGASVLANNPIDVIKTRMQGLESKKYKNSFDCFYKILWNEGPLAFYKGCLPRLGRACLDVAISFAVYDSIKELLDRVWP